MNKDDFEESLRRISSSFQSSKSKIGAGSSSWKIHASRLQQIASDFNKKGSATIEYLKELQQIWISNAPFIDEKGKPFVLYIRDHSHMNKFGRSSDYRKFHVAWCRTMDYMEKGGRSDRYFKKADINNPEFIITFDARSSSNKALHVCKNCLGYMASEENDTRFNVNNFAMPAFFEMYTKKRLKEPTRRAGVTDYYPENWDAMSRRIREEANWMCQDCGRSFVNDKSKLHVHHKNGVPGDVNRSNLEVVCNDCHAKKFAHGHMKQSNNSFNTTRAEAPKQSTELSQSERNKFESFISAPEKYATGSTVTKEKIQFLKGIVQDKRDALSDSDKSSFLQAVKKYQTALSKK